MDVRSCLFATIDSNHSLGIAHLRAQKSNLKKITGIRSSKYNVSKLISSEVAKQYRQQMEEKLNHITEQDNGEKLWKRCKTVVNSLAEEVLGIMELANKGKWFDAECQAATENKNKSFKKMQQGYSTRSLIEEYKDKRRKEKPIHKRKKKEWMNVKLENMELPM
jgi:ABC-type thiamine transport system substrate-binding protein